MTTRIKVICSGTIFGGLVDCYVLDNGKRMISQRGALRALRGKARADGGAEDGDISRFIGRLPIRFAVLSAAPTFEMVFPTGGVAIGRDAEWLVDVLQAYVDAHFEGELHHAQEALARNAAALLKSLGKVGITALIDEATGYEQHREQGALGRLFDRIFRKTIAPWERMFDDDLIRALCKLDGVEWSGGRHPRHLGSTQEKIYSMILGSDVGLEMQRRNPLPCRGRNHHQTLAKEAQSDLRIQLSFVTVIANQSQSKSDFWARMDRQYGDGFLQTELQLS